MATATTTAVPLWTTARTAADWLARTNGTSPHQTAMLLMKITEEAGEVTAAYIGMTGQNPRKGQTHTAEDVARELCDVILAAATALHRFTDDPAGFMDAQAARVGARIAAIAGDGA
jgi:NTP pyrophosphatase (non-canonical NTP hydrolase)